MQLSKTACVVFDTETTGIDTAEDRVVEFGAVHRDGHGTVRLSHHYIHPGVAIPAEATQIHGISDEKVADCPSFGALASTLAQHLSSGILVGYNAASYDAAILNAEFTRHGHPFRIDARQVIDPVVFVRWHLRHLKGRRLGDMCAHFGVVLEHAHTAVADAHATLELLDRMIAEGLIPDDVEEALDMQWRFARCQEVERAQWSYWLFRDRQHGHIRMGAGKHVGTPLRNVDFGFLRWILNNVSDLHPGARDAFIAELRRRSRAAIRPQNIVSRGGWP